MRFSHDSAACGIGKPSPLLFSVPAAVSGVNGANPTFMCVIGACSNNRLTVFLKGLSKSETRENSSVSKASCFLI